MNRATGWAVCLCLSLAASTASAGNKYVWLSGGNTWPYESLDTAATSIQVAVDAAAPGETVWVTNGTYDITSQVTISNAIALCSVDNDPAGTTIRRASGTTRIVEIQSGAAGAVLSGFTVREGIRSGDFEQGGGIRIWRGWRPPRTWMERPASIPRAARTTWAPTNTSPAR